MDGRCFERVEQRRMEALSSCPLTFLLLNRFSKVKYALLIPFLLLFSLPPTDPNYSMFFTCHIASFSIINCIITSSLTSFISSVYFGSIYISDFPNSPLALSLLLLPFFHTLTPFVHVFIHE